MNPVTALTTALVVAGLACSSAIDSPNRLSSTSNVLARIYQKRTSEGHGGSVNVMDDHVTASKNFSAILTPSNVGRFGWETWQMAFGLGTPRKYKLLWCTENTASLETLRLLWGGGPPFTRPFSAALQHDDRVQRAEPIRPLHRLQRDSVQRPVCEAPHIQRGVS